MIWSENFVGRMQQILVRFSGDKDEDPSVLVPGTLTSYLLPSSTRYACAAGIDTFPPFPSGKLDPVTCSVRKDTLYS